MCVAKLRYRYDTRDCPLCMKVKYVDMNSYFAILPFKGLVVCSDIFLRLKLRIVTFMFAVVVCDSEYKYLLKSRIFLSGQKIYIRYKIHFSFNIPVSEII